MENTITVEGKKYIEYDQAKELKRQKVRDVIILILIAAVLVALVLAITTLVKNADIINKDALIIGMEKHDFVSCQCTDSNNAEWYSQGSGFTTQSKPTNDDLRDIIKDLGIWE